MSELLLRECLTLLPLPAVLSSPNHHKPQGESKGGGVTATGKLALQMIGLLPKLFNLGVMLIPDM